MKKALAAILGLSLLMALAACGGDNSTPASTPADSRAPASIVSSLPDSEPLSTADESGGLLRTLYGLPFDDFPLAQPGPEARAEELLDMIHARDYDTLYENVHPDLIAVMDKETFATQVNAALDTLGEYKGYSDEISPMQDEADDPTYGSIVAVMIECEYDNGFGLWQVTLDSDQQATALLLVATR